MRREPVDVVPHPWFMRRLRWTTAPVEHERTNELLEITVAPGKKQALRWGHLVSLQDDHGCSAL